MARQMGAMDDAIHRVDGFPVPVCKYTRASSNRCFKGEADFSYCAAKDEKYYGFEGHVLISFEGIICGYAFTPANVDERDVLPEMTTGVHGLLIGDKGISAPVSSRSCYNKVLICRLLYGRICTTQDPRRLLGN